MIGSCVYWWGQSMIGSTLGDWRGMGKFQVFQYPYVIALGFLTFPRKSLFQFSVWQVPEHV